MYFDFVIPVRFNVAYLTIETFYKKRPFIMKINNPFLSEEEKVPDTIDPLLLQSRNTSGKRNNHAVVYIPLGIICFITFLFAYLQGEAKPWSFLEWIDVIGEGAVIVTSILWLHLTLLWRPPGLVTRWLAGGFALLTFGFYVDLVDEFIFFSGLFWTEALESIVTPTALFVLTYAAWLLSKEQRILQRQQKRREADYRDHDAIHTVTDLYNASYCRQVLDNIIQQKKSVSIWMIDLEDFDSINQKFGFAIGDKILNRIASTLIATAPESSLVFHYAGDRFIVISPYQHNTSSLKQNIEILLSNAISLALSNETNDTILTAIHVINIAPQEKENASQVFERACKEIEMIKRADCG